MIEELKNITNTNIELNDDQKRKLVQAAVEFEALLVSNMLKAMNPEPQEEDGEDSLFSTTSSSRSMYMGFVLDSVSRNIAESGGLHLAESIVSSYGIDFNDYIKDIRRESSFIQSWNNIPPIADFPVNIPDNSSTVNSELQITSNALYEADSYDEIISEAARIYNLDPKLIRALIMIESGGHQNITSNAGAGGLMQLMPDTARSLGVTDVFNPVQNIFGGCKYLRAMMDRYDNNVELALAAYNAGPGAVDRYNGIPPYNETQNYVRAVSGLWNKYKESE